MVKSETGITTFFLDKKIDTGKIILQEKEVIQEDDDFGTLYGKLMVKGAALILKTSCSDRKRIQAAPLCLRMMKTQNPSAPKIFKKDCEINWDQEADRVSYNFVRGMSPYPTAWCQSKP